MQCPWCGQDNDKVIDTRPIDGGKATRRRRSCLACGRRYYTFERPEESARLRVIKKDGSRVPYDRQKIIEGLQKACYKRPVGDEEIRAVVDAVEEDIEAQFDRAVPSTFIGDAVARRLKDVDKIAYVRFASVYRQFQDVGELIDEAKKIESTTGGEETALPSLFGDDAKEPK
ncbi:MAG: transcriptional repressor NrdR [Planctomycetes bacterium]|jgi:transcriptional repressor NrdR|nr:transcriptional repressor NrdR [Planctomycetota bacterium]